MSAKRILTTGFLAASLVLACAAAARAEVTDEQVRQAINRGKEYLIGLQNADGAFGQKGRYGYGESCLAFMTLAYMQMHPNREVMSKAMDFHMTLDPDTQMGNKQGYALPIRLMGLSYLHDKLLGKKKGQVRRRMYQDVTRLRMGQNAAGGWRYELDAEKEDWDFSVSQWPILAYRDAALVGIEVPKEPLFKARELYYAKQRPDGGYNYGWYPRADTESTGSMTAAGLASLYIIQDLLEPGAGCPCQGGRSQRTVSETDRRIDRALAWLAKRFSVSTNPGMEGGRQRILYWLYCVERVGIAAGYKYFGQHDWYAEGAEYLLEKQHGNGSWGGITDTCFALLFLYKGRAPILFNKLRFDGVWNAHRRDIANLTRYIERIKEQQFHWQIVELTAPLDELHDAPILYITAESAPNFSEADRKKLRAFTDTGGTILFEASCGNRLVKGWFRKFAAQVWPEWPLQPLGPDHGIYTHPYDLKDRPEILGIDDGVRTCVVFAMDDISCPWHTKAFAGKSYLFNWGINLFTYATDGAPLRAKLAGRATVEKAGRYAGPVEAGPSTNLRLARVRHGGNWEVGANYGGLRMLAAQVKETAGVNLEVTEPTAAPFDQGGVAPEDLTGYDIAYVAGSKSMEFTPAEQAALRQFVEGGGFLWLEAAGGSSEFDGSVQKLSQALGWEARLLPTTHELVTGRMEGATGHNISSGVEFRRVLRVIRLGRKYAELLGLFSGGRLVGIYSPVDISFSLNPYEAYRCKGYKPADAEAVATNILLYVTTRKP
jgi:hypothetical protein